MTERCFITHSSTDARGFATRLTDALEDGHPSIPVWLDQRDIRRGIDLDLQIDDALKACRLVLYLMTPDSIIPTSICWQECSRALSYRKTVIPLLMKENVPTPSRLRDRQKIDFTDGFDLGVARLREHLAWMETPAGALQNLKDRLADTEHDLHGVQAAEYARIWGEIEALKKQIERQKK